MDGPVVEGIARRYLEDIFSPAVTAARPDTLLLGCTHFPLLQTALQHVVGPQVRIVDSAATTAESVQTELAPSEFASPRRRRVLPFFDYR